eukprot:Clim_evm24s246 gene=Clim_evmTU24s246
MYGDNRNGTIAGLAAPDARMPYRVTFFDDKGCNAISMSDMYSVAADWNGDLWAWGKAIPGSDIEQPVKLARKRNGNGNGNGNGEDHIEEDQVEDVVEYETAMRTVYVPVSVLSGQHIGQVKATHGGIYGLSNTNRLFFVGIQPNQDGTVNLAKPMDITPDKGTHAALVPGENISELTSGYHHIVLLTDRGRVLSAPTTEDGNNFGQLGQGHQNKVPQNEFSVVPGFTGDVVKQVSCGAYHCIALTGSGEAYVWGSDHQMQLGLGNPNNSGNKPYCRNRPVFMNGLWQQGADHEGREIALVEAGDNNSLFVVDSATGTETYTVGNGRTGSLGNGMWIHMTGNLSRVKHLNDLRWYDEQERKSKNIKVYSVTCGARHCALALDTRYSPTGGLDVYSWGYNRYGQCGNTKRANLAEPEFLLDPERKRKHLQLSHKKRSYGQQAIHCSSNNTAIILPQNLNDMEFGQMNPAHIRKKIMVLEHTLKQRQSAQSALRVQHAKLLNDIQDQVTKIEEEIDRLRSEASKKGG